MCSIERTRASGPGGQHRNKVETAIVVTHQSTGVTGQASEKRSQHANLKTALERLRLQLAIEVRSTPLLRGPDDLWRSRVKGRKIKVSLEHADFPKLVVVALDVLEGQQLNVAEAAKVLEVSTSQLIKFLKSNSTVGQHVQRTRQIAGLAPLR